MKGLTLSKNSKTLLFILAAVGQRLPLLRRYIERAKANNWKKHQKRQRNADDEIFMCCFFSYSGKSRRTEVLEVVFKNF